VHVYWNVRLLQHNPEVYHCKSRGHALFRNRSVSRNIRFNMQRDANYVGMCDKRRVAYRRRVMQMRFIIEYERVSSGVVLLE
jgi:hypothetical protein